MAKNRIITVQNIPIAVTAEEMDDYICITDIADAKSNQYRAADIIRNWLCHTSPQYIIRIIRFTLPQISQYGGTTIEKHLTAREHYRRGYICQLKTHG